jgi:hypothetical protein
MVYRQCLWRGRTKTTEVRKGERKTVELLKRREGGREGGKEGGREGREDARW